jgi:hypothetical protein
VLVDDGGNPLERALKAEGVAGKLADVARSIYQQESESGRNTRTSNAGAVGGMQITPGTFRRFSDKGWSIDNDDQAARAAVRYLKSLSAKTGGDAGLMSVGYYGGEGAIPKAKAGVGVRDPRNPKAPDTLQYAQQVLKRIGGAVESVIPSAQAAEPRAAADPDWLQAGSVPVQSKTAVAAPAAAAPGEQRDPSFWNELARQVGLTVRAGVTGASSLPMAVGNAPNALLNLGIGGVNRLAGSNIRPFQLPSDMLQRGMTAAGVPEPANATERVVQDAAGGMAGAGGSVALAKGASAAIPAIKNALIPFLEGTGMQTASGAASGLAGGTAREAGAGPVGQIAASMAGGMLPPVATAAAAGTTRNILRGGAANIPAMEERAKTFQEAGAERPSAGQVTGRRFTQGLESALSKTPGGAGQMAKTAEREAEDIGRQATKIADQLSFVATPSTAGRAIEKGISGPEGFIQRFKAGQKALYSKLDTFIPDQAAVDVSRTKSVLSQLNEDIPNAPALSKWFKNAKIEGIEEAMKSDTGGAKPTASPILSAEGKPFTTPGTPPTNKLPYEAVKKLRTLVGAELENNSLTSDVPRSKWKALYAALSQDLDGAARSTGKPEAVKAMSRANRFTAAGHQRIEDVLDGVMKRNTPEEIFKAATSTSDMQAGATKIASVMKSLQPAERDVVKGAFVRRMGMATPGNQGAAGETFSTQTFLTNWNRMSPQAKDVMFSSKGGELRKNLDQIAKASDYIKQGSKVFANPSGTAPAMLLAGDALAAATAVATGNFGAAAALLGTAGAANLTARLMTHQPFVKWLAKSTQLSPQALPAAINSLARQASGYPQDVQADLQSYIDGLSQKQGQ